MAKSIWRLALRLAVTLFVTSSLADSAEAASMKKEAALSKVTAVEWADLTDTANVAQRQVAWKIAVTTVASFGGFYVKGHLEQSEEARVHLVWEKVPESRKGFSEGVVLTVIGDLVGLTQEGEAIVMVKRVYR